MITPFDPFTVSQEEFQRQYALTAREIAEGVFEKAVAPAAMKGSRTIDVYNTACWDRGVPVPGDVVARGNTLQNGPSPRKLSETPVGAP